MYGEVAEKEPVGQRREKVKTIPHLATSVLSLALSSVSC